MFQTTYTRTIEHLMGIIEEQRTMLEETARYEQELADENSRLRAQLYRLMEAK